MSLRTSAKANRKRRPWPFDLPIAKVSPVRPTQYLELQLTLGADANLFKEAFIKAQQDNEKLLTSA